MTPDEQDRALDESIAVAEAAAQELHAVRWAGLSLEDLRDSFARAHRALDDALVLALVQPIGRHRLISALREHREELALTARDTTGIAVPDTVRPRSLAALGPPGIVGDAEPLPGDEPRHGMDLRVSLDGYAQT